MQHEGGLMSGPLGPLKQFGYGVSGFLPLGRFLAGGASRHIPRPGLTRRGLFLSPISHHLARHALQHRCTDPLQVSGA